MTDRVGKWARIKVGSMQGQRLLVTHDHGEQGVSAMMPGAGKTPPQPGLFYPYEFVVEEED